MNYDPVKFCWQCQRSKPRDSFGPVRPGSKRQACEQCREKINEAQADREAVEAR